MREREESVVVQIRSGSVKLSDSASFVEELIELSCEGPYTRVPSVKWGFTRSTVLYIAWF